MILSISPEAQAIAACESGNTADIDSINYNAVNKNTDGTYDTGAWQFNSYWVWSKSDRWAIIPVANNVYDMSSTDFLKKYPTAKSAPPSVQYEMFKFLWKDGYGWRHWSSSKSCWSKWIVVVDGKAVMR